MKTHKKNQAYVTETLKFRAGSLGGLAHQEVHFKAPEKSNVGSPYVKVDCWDENAVKNVSRLIAAAPDLLSLLHRVLAYEQRLIASKTDGGIALVSDIRSALAKADGTK